MFKEQLFINLSKAGIVPIIKTSKENNALNCKCDYSNMRIREDIYIFVKDKLF